MTEAEARKLVQMTLEALHARIYSGAVTKLRPGSIDGDEANTILSSVCGVADGLIQHQEEIINQIVKSVEEQGWLGFFTKTTEDKMRAIRLSGSETAWCSPDEFDPETFAMLLSTLGYRVVRFYPGQPAPFPLD